MARNSELVRQWEILRAIDGARNGIAIGKLASERGVHQRTIGAISTRSAVPVSRSTTRRSTAPACGSCAAGLRAASRRRARRDGAVRALFQHARCSTRSAGAPLLDDGGAGVRKIERALPVASRRFLDQLPRILKAKADGRKKQDERRVREILGRMLDATARSTAARRCAMRRRRRAGRRPIRRRVASGWPTPTAASTCSPGCRRTARCARSRPSGSRRSR